MSMLWESAEPADRLRRRFGFPSAASAAAWVAVALERWWGLAVSDCDRLVLSDWNLMAWVAVDRQHFVAKWSALPARFGRITEAARVTAWLEARGVPVAGPIVAVDGSLVVETTMEHTRVPTAKERPSRRDDGGSRVLLGLFPVIDGELLDVEDPGQVDDAARMLSALHRELASYPGEFDGGSPRDREQLVHNDFRSANLLHDGARITGVLDFEELAYATRVADLAKSSVFLATQYRNWQPTSPEVREAFIAAYEADAPMTSADHRELAEHVTANLRSQGWA